MPTDSPQRAEALDNLIHSFKDTARSTMTVQIPRLLVSDLTGAIYIVTKWREGDCGSFLADEKFNITDEFLAIEAQRLAEAGDKPCDGAGFFSGCSCIDCRKRFCTTEAEQEEPTDA